MILPRNSQGVVMPAQDVVERLLATGIRLRGIEEYPSNLMQRGRIDALSVLELLVKLGEPVTIPLSFEQVGRKPPRNPGINFVGLGSERLG